MPETPGKNAYTKQELIDVASAQGFKLTGRRIHDWVEVGLLAGPKRKGLGRGRGTACTWPDNQLRLLLTLLYKRENETGEIGTLANIPVWLWLEWGESYAPLSQVRKALATWKARYIAPRSLIKRRRAARQFTEILDHIITRKSDRKELIDKLADMQFRRKIDEGVLREWFRKVCGPINLGLVCLSVDLIKARYLALNNLESFSGEEFEQARRHYVASVIDYWRTYPELSKLPQIGRRLEGRKKDDQERVNNACLSLITELGMLRLEGAKDSPEKSAEVNPNKV